LYGDKHTESSSVLEPNNLVT